MRGLVDYGRAAGVYCGDIGAVERVIAGQGNLLRGALAQAGIERFQGVATRLQKLQLPQRIDRRQIADRVVVNAEPFQVAENLDSLETADACSTQARRPSSAMSNSENSFGFSNTVRSFTV